MTKHTKSITHVSETSMKKILNKNTFNQILGRNAKNLIRTALILNNARQKQIMNLCNVQKKKIP